MKNTLKLSILGMLFLIPAQSYATDGWGPEDRRLLELGILRDGDVLHRDQYFRKSYPYFSLLWHLDNPGRGVDHDLRSDPLYSRLHLMSGSHVGALKEDSSWVGLTSDQLSACVPGIFVGPDVNYLIQSGVFDSISQLNRDKMTLANKCSATMKINSDFTTYIRDFRKHGADFARDHMLADGVLIPLDVTEDEELVAEALVAAELGDGGEASAAGAAAGSM